MLTEVKKHLTPKQIWADAEFFFLLNLGLVATAAGIALFKTPKTGILRECNFVLLQKGGRPDEG